MLVNFKKLFCVSVRCPSGPCDGVRKPHWAAKSSFTFNWPPPGLFDARQPITIQQDIIELPLTKQLAAYVPALDPGCRTKQHQHMKLSKPRRITASEVCKCLQMWGIQPPAVLQDPCNAEKQVIYVPHQPQQQDSQDSETCQRDAVREQHPLDSRDPCSSISDQAYQAAVQAARTAARVQAMADIVALDETYSAADKEEAQQLAQLACAAARQAACGATSIVKACHKPTNCGVNVCSDELPANSRTAAAAAYRKEAIDILQEAAAASSQQSQQHSMLECPQLSKRQACEQAVEDRKQRSCLPAALQRQYTDEEVMMALEWALLKEHYNEPVGISGVVKLLQTKQQQGISRWELLSTAVTKLPLLWTSKDSSSDEAAELLEQLKREAREDQPLARTSSSLEQQLWQKDRVREGRQLLVECKVWNAMSAPSKQYLQPMRTARLWPAGLRQLGLAAAKHYNKAQQEKKAEEERRQQQQAAELAAAAAAGGSPGVLPDAGMRPASPAGTETSGHSSSRASTPENDGSSVFTHSLSPGSIMRSDASGYTEASLETNSCSSYNYSCSSKATNSVMSHGSTVGSALASVRRFVVDSAALRGSKTASPASSSMSSPHAAAATAADPVTASNNSFTARAPSPRAASRLGLASRTASASALAAQEEQAAAGLWQQQQRQQQQLGAGGLFERLRRTVTRRDSAASTSGSSKGSSSSDVCSPVSSTAPSSILHFAVDMEPVSRLRSGSSLLHIAQRKSAAGREAMMHGAEPARSFGDPKQLAAALQRCSSPELAGLTPAARAAAQMLRSVAVNAIQGSSVAAAPGLTPASGPGAAAEANGMASPACPASEEPAADEPQDFQAMWQSIAAHHGLDPQPSLAHEQQLAELTRGPVRRKKGAARYA
jgi:hypothetical protein